MSNRSAGYAGHVIPVQTQPEIQIIKLHKSTNGMGLSIVAAKVVRYIHFLLLLYFWLARLDDQSFFSYFFIFSTINILKIKLLFFNPANLF